MERVIDMQLSTHLHIADTLHQDFDKQLSKLFFKIGSISPDLWPPLRLRSHYERGSGYYIRDKVAQLAQKRASSKLYLSLQLGIISHFLTDFSCLVHQDDHSVSFIEHTKYEKYLTQHHHNDHPDIIAAIDRSRDIISHVFRINLPLASIA